jgi:hypothetical protein
MNKTTEKIRKPGIDIREELMSKVSTLNKQFHAQQSKKDMSILRGNRDEDMGNELRHALNAWKHRNS